MPPLPKENKKANAIMLDSVIVFVWNSKSKIILVRKFKKVDKKL